MFSWIETASSLRRTLRSGVYRTKFSLGTYVIWYDNSYKTQAVQATAVAEWENGGPNFVICINKSDQLPLFSYGYAED